MQTIFLLLFLEIHNISILPVKEKNPLSSAIDHQNISENFCTEILNLNLVENMLKECLPLNFIPMKLKELLAEKQ
jgi:hypothetical protein